MGVFDSSTPSSNPDALSEKYGANGAAGSAGEKHYLRALERAGITERFHVVHSVSIPVSSRDGKQWGGDVDVAVASGNDLVLIDVKRWSPAFYWSLPNGAWPMKNLERLRKDNGEWVSSQNMALARDRFVEALPGVNIHVIVVFVPTDKTGTVPQSVRFLSWPGGIRSHLAAESFEVLYDFLGTPRAPTTAARSLLASLKR